MEALALALALVYPSVGVTIGGVVLYLEYSSSHDCRENLTGLVL